MAEKKEEPEELDVEEGEGEEGEGEGEGEGKKKKLTGRTIVLFIALPILVVVLLGVGALMFFGGGDDDAGHLAADGADDPHASTMLDPTQVVFYEFPELLVNLNSSGPRATFLKLEVALEISKDQDITILEAAVPRVRDNFQVYLRELRMEDLSGASGTQRVKEELLRRVNLAAQPVEVNAVLIKEMVIQ